MTAHISRAAGMKLELPFPPASLTPHAKGGWWTKAGETKRYRALCSNLGYEAGLHLLRPDAIRARVTIHRPNLRRDFQNCISCFKAGVDGLADAAKLDDRHWKIEFVEGEPDRPKGRVVVEIEAVNNG